MKAICFSALLVLIPLKHAYLAAEQCFDFSESVAVELTLCDLGDDRMAFLAPRIERDVPKLPPD